MTDTPPTPDTYLPELFLRPAHIDEVDTPALLGVVLVDGHAMLRSVHFVRPVDPNDLVGTDWPAHVDFAVKVETLYTLTDGTIGAMLDSAQMAAVERVAGRHKVAPATIRQAADAYRHGGVKGITDRLNVSERTAHRYLKRAVDEGLVTR